MKTSFSLYTIAVLLAILPVSMLFAQDRQTLNHHNMKLAIEFGTNEITGKLMKPEQMRENKSSGYFSNDKYYEYGYLEKSNTFTTMYFGVKPEFFIYKNRIGIASGIRLTSASSELTSQESKFLWKVREEGLNTDYIKIDDIRQKSYLLSIPFEFRYFMNKRELPFQTYFKIGASMNYPIKTENWVNFTDKNMEKYRNIVKNQLSGNENSISAFFFGAFGFKIGKYKEERWIPWGNLELHFPYLLLTKKSFEFTGNGYLGIGFQCSFEIPIGQNVPIGSE